MINDVPVFPVRTTNAGIPVTRGRLDLLPSPSAALPPRVNLSTFTSLLQCAPTEPDLDAAGALSLMRLVPPTQEMLALVSTWVETGCAEMKDGPAPKDAFKDPVPWAACRDHLAAVHAGRRQFRPDDVNFVANELNVNHFAWPILLLRVTAGRLFYDWPYGVARFATRGYVKVLPPLSPPFAFVVLSLAHHPRPHLHPHPHRHATPAA